MTQDNNSPAEIEQSHQTSRDTIMALTCLIRVAQPHAVRQTKLSGEI